MKKISVEHDPELDREFPKKRSTIIEIKNREGKVFSGRYDVVKGEPDFPLSQSEIKSKFNMLSSKVMNKEGREKIINYINGIETVEDISSFFPMLKSTEKT